MVTHAGALTPEAVLAVLDSVMDPEVPVISVRELGIVRDVEVHGNHAIVTVTPTYSGCPAMQVIERDIVAAVQGMADGVECEVRTSFSPAWTTDWIPASAREKLRAYGIAPPGPADHDAPVAIGRRRPAIRCPFCGSSRTELRSEFGSTACKSIHVCADCRQPFEEFKAI
jgi:ring-1,2-phenylacetyl-CoA epoxidase subunit PaaD